jgi:hypothetical protein
MGIYDFAGSDDFQSQQITRLNGNSPYRRNGALVSQSGSYSPISAEFFDNGGISLSGGGVSLTGGTANTISEAGFAYVAQNPFVDTVTLYWDGTNGSQLIAQRRTDGTRAPVPAGSLVISGLVASKRYYFLPFWAANNPCSIGFVPGTHGTPQILFQTISNRLDQVQLQSLNSREPLSSGFVYFDTPAAGGSGGGGGSPEPIPDRCVMLGTDIEPYRDTEYTAKHEKCHQWWHLVTKSGKSLYCTPNHPVYTWDGHRIEAQEVKVGMALTTIDGDDEVVVSESHIRLCTKVSVTMPKIRLFWANGILSHNVKL